MDKQAENDVQLLSLAEAAKEHGISAGDLAIAASQGKVEKIIGEDGWSSSFNSADVAAYVATLPSPDAEVEAAPAAEVVSEVAEEAAPVIEAEPAAEVEAAPVEDVVVLKAAPAEEDVPVLKAVTPVPYSQRGTPEPLGELGDEPTPADDFSFDVIQETPAATIEEEFTLPEAPKTEDPTVTKAKAAALVASLTMPKVVEPTEVIELSQARTAHERKNQVIPMRDRMKPGTKAVLSLAAAASIVAGAIGFMFGGKSNAPSDDSANNPDANGSGDTAALVEEGATASTEGVNVIQISQDTYQSLTDGVASVAAGTLAEVLQQPVEPELVVITAEEEDTVSVEQDDATPTLDLSLMPSEVSTKPLTRGLSTPFSENTSGNTAQTSSTITKPAEEGNAWTIKVLKSNAHKDIYEAPSFNVATKAGMTVDPAPQPEGKGGGVTTSYAPQASPYAPDYSDTQDSGWYGSAYAAQFTSHASQFADGQGAVSMIGAQGGYRNENFNLHTGVRATSGENKIFATPDGGALGDSAIEYTPQGFSENAHTVFGLYFNPLKQGLNLNGHDYTDSDPIGTLTQGPFSNNLDLTGKAGVVEAAITHIRQDGDTTLVVEAHAGTSVSATQGHYEDTVLANGHDWHAGASLQWVKEHYDGDVTELTAAIEYTAWSGANGFDTKEVGPFTIDRNTPSGTYDYIRDPIFNSSGDNITISGLADFAIAAENELEVGLGLRHINNDFMGCSGRSFTSSVSGLYNVNHQGDGDLDGFAGSGELFLNQERAFNDNIDFGGGARVTYDGVNDGGTNVAAFLRVAYGLLDDDKPDVVLEAGYGTDGPQVQAGLRWEF